MGGLDASPPDLRGFPASRILASQVESITGLVQIPNKSHESGLIRIRERHLECLVWRRSRTVKLGVVGPIEAILEVWSRFPAGCDQIVPAHPRFGRQTNRVRSQPIPIFSDYCTGIGNPRFQQGERPAEP